MATVELESFLSKFKYLCNAGYNASLTFKAENGSTDISFNVSLGFIHPPMNYPPPGFSAVSSTKKRNASYIRRQERRRSLRADNEKIDNAERVSVKTEEVETEESIEAKVVNDNHVADVSLDIPTEVQPSISYSASSVQGSSSKLSSSDVADVNVSLAEKVKKASDDNVKVEKEEEVNVTRAKPSGMSKGYICELCEFRSLHESGLKSHMEYKHRKWIQDC